MGFLSAAFNLLKRMGYSHGRFKNWPKNWSRTIQYRFVILYFLGSRIITTLVPVYLHPLVIQCYHFFLVHQGNWHGDIAIKFLDMESTEDEATLEAFRKEVATFRKTRHENLILFMGACMNPPKLAIVTSLCKGENCSYFEFNIFSRI